jgi:hypothetical protein
MARLSGSRQNEGVGAEESEILAIQYALLTNEGLRKQPLKHIDKIHDAIVTNNTKQRLIAEVLRTIDHHLTKVH